MTNGQWESYHLRQADTFTRLMDRLEPEPGEDIQRLAKELEKAEQKNALLREKNQQLQSQILIPQSSQPERNARESLMLVKQAVRRYLQLTRKEEGVSSPPIKPVRYDRLPNARSYQYPAGEGCYVIELHALAWGKSRQPVQFIFGRAEDGALQKYRYYGKREFVGCALKDSPYASYGSRWLIAVRRAMDGAMDMAAAFPLPGRPFEKSKKTLDELILSAREG